MAEPKDYTAGVPAAVKRLEKGRWHAWPVGSGGAGVEGQGASEKEARDDLVRNLAWVLHYIGAFVALDGEGAPWICTVAAHHGAWYVKRATPEGMSTGVSVVPARSRDALREAVAQWNKPE